MSVLRIHPWEGTYFYIYVRDLFLLISNKINPPPSLSFLLFVKSLRMSKQCRLWGNLIKSINLNSFRVSSVRGICSSTLSFLANIPRGEPESELFHSNPRDEREAKDTRDKSALNIASTLQNITSLFQEKEWECWCGHKFRAPGIWTPCSATLCQAPKCPSPRYFIEGEGRSRLEREQRLGIPTTPLLSTNTTSTPSFESYFSDDPPEIIYMGSGAGKK